MPGRELYIDRLRVVMTALVILHHTALTYGAIGGWFWRELDPSASVSSRLLILFCTTNQAYFMGFFFLLAGYFTPLSLERKGYARFLCDRFLRLGIPLLAFGLFLGPLTAAIVEAFQGRSFWGTFVWLWNHKQFINGPLWFAQALLIFSLAYCLWRKLAGAPLTQSERAPKLVPSNIWWIISAIAVGAIALLIRQFVPVGVNVWGLQLAYFSSYIFLFALGIAAWRHDWLRQLTWKNSRLSILRATLFWIAMPVATYFLATHSGGGSGKSNVPSGLSVSAIFYAFWEPLVAWGLIAAWLLAFRKWQNQPSNLWSWLGRRAYAVYIIHPVILVLISLLLHGWAAPALIKFTATGSLTIVACWLLSDPLVRLPGLRRIV
ncbi:acyltransferase family protein [Terracidiphilus gabretensis]|uniref:acyltransferase family protein n=1 Tax=Terracidiphilus gabretensis TaxID=1577687 RepID=UPI00071B7BB7|nr:acyltransferase family protein [Terracidiphilus gabretensis]